eukprot:535140-Prymnesium_polylepis.1
MAPQALKAYETAASLLKQSKQRLPAELWNNLGALRHRLGKLDSAEHAYLHALKVCPPLCTHDTPPSTLS